MSLLKSFSEFRNSILNCKIYIPLSQGSPIQFLRHLYCNVIYSVSVCLAVTVENAGCEFFSQLSGLNLFYRLVIMYTNQI